MATFFEQLRESLAPEFQLEGELGSGGMGTVFLARDVALDRPVAIKAMRPEDASAVAVERFRVEAQTLAKLRHAHIVNVHSTGVARGLGIPYYVMDYLVGETLEQRLAKGPVGQDEAIGLCLQLLDALDAAHRHGIVHRDIKPSNVFLEDGRAILTDFGISKRLNQQEAGPTAPGQPIGTPLYMPWEQAAGQEVTTRTDLCALGFAGYESLTGRKFLLEPPGAPDWGSVPKRLRQVFERAVAVSPDERWPDAKAFSRALRRAAHGRSARVQTARVALVAAVAILAYLAWPRGPVANLRVESLRAENAGSLAFLGDSLAADVARRLVGFPDLTVLGPGQSGRARNVISGVVELVGGTLHATMRLRDRAFAVRASPDDWRSAAEQLADSVLLRVYGAGLDSQLPVRVLPGSSGGLQAFLTAEKLFAAAHWREAYAAYDRATNVDSTCWLCWWRRGETRRWLGTDADTEAIRHSLAHLSLFPPQYQSLIRVDTMMLLARFDTLDRLRARYPTFLFGLFRYGDELMHRGALIGRDPGEAARYLQDALNVRPDFAPAVEHMLWLALLVDDSSRARGGFAALNRTALEQHLTSGIPEMLKAAYVWRFLPTEQAEAGTQQAIADAKRKGIGELDVGARYMNGFSLPRGELFIAQELESDPRYRRSALIARMFGELALGRPDSTRARLDRLQEEFPDPGNTLIGLELDALRVLLDGESGGATAQAHDLSAALARISELNVPGGLKIRAQWLARILQCRFFGPEAVWAPVSRAIAVPVRLDQVVQACDLARAGRPMDALDATKRFTDLPAPLTAEYPAYRASVYALRATWWHRLGRDEAAARELLWVENFDEATLPTGDPQPMEVDWALRPLARWGRARLLASFGRREDLCRLYGSVVRSWHEGEGPFAARADSAARLAEALGCSKATS